MRRHHGSPRLRRTFRQALGVQISIFLRTRAKAVRAVSGEAKGLLLSVSPFHVVQEGFRAAMMGINPFKADHININETLPAAVS